MNPEVGSIGAYLNQLFPVPVHTEKTKDGFEVPSIYIPAPSITDGNDTVSTYRITYTLNVKIFHKTSNQAFEEAEKLADTIRNKRSLIPLVDEEGDPTGQLFRIRGVEARGSNQGFASLILNWDSRYKYDKPVFPSLEDVEINNEVRS